MITRSFRKFIYSGSSLKKYLLLLTLFLFTGCRNDANLAKVREFARYANEANEQMSEIT